MELILTGATSPALDMERLGIVNRVVSSEEDVLEAAMKIARIVASFSAPAIGLAKQAVLAGECRISLAIDVTRLTQDVAETTNLKEGLEIERALYYSSFSLADCREGVAAFKEKRKANFEHC